MNNTQSSPTPICRNNNATDHEWWVFSTCLETCELMLRCSKTDAFAVVPNPTQAEWKEAYYAPRNPYPWPESKKGRVIVKWPIGAHTLCRHVTFPGPMTVRTECPLN
jgi:hypothetical protein